MRKKLILFLCLSLSGHLLGITGFLFFLPPQLDRPAGQNNKNLSLVFGSPVQSDLKHPKHDITLRKNNKNRVKMGQGPNSKVSMKTNHDGGMNSNQSQGQSFSDTGQGTNPTLKKIKAQILKHQNYPLIAKKRKQEGKTQVEFQLDPSGRLQNLKIKRSSGFTVLDQSALQAVQKAQPFPYYASTITFTMTYELH